jgi:hypothetical protein
MYVMMENARVLKHVSIVRKIVVIVHQYVLDLLNIHSLKVLYVK